jgi:hypothetical protein
MFKSLQSISCPGGGKNLDYIHATDNCVLLLDGSTPLQSGAYDASKFNADFALALIEHLRDESDLTSAVNLSIDELFECFKGQNREYSLDYYPSSTLLAALDCGEYVHIVCLGDSTAVIVMKDGSKVTISCDDVKKLDNKVIDRLVEIRNEKKIDIRDVMGLAEIKDMLLSHRKKMNAEGGYEILSFNMRKLDSADIKTFKKEDIDRIIFYSDGFDMFREDLAASDVDLSALYEKLRREENEDFLLNKNPRFKVSDDASAIVFEII